MSKINENANTSTSSKNKMGYEKIPKLLISMAIPMVISMLIQALYNIVDSMFVAQISENALTAVSLVFPIQNLMIAVSVGTGVGINALVSRYLGENRKDDANTVAKNGMFLSIISAIIFAILGVAFARTFFELQTSNKEIVTYGTQYMVVISLFSIALFVQITLERLMQSTGKTLFNMYTQGLGAIINIILDPIFIFGLFGFPRMEVLGAAVATVTGQILAVCFSLYLNIYHNKEINFNMHKFKPCKSTIADIYKIGIPSIIMQSIGSIMTLGMNNILLMFSSTATAVFGIYFKLQSFVFMPVFAITNATVPIVAFNYGAKNKSRIMSTYRLSCALAVGVMLLGFLAFQTATIPLLELFDASKDMLNIGIPALRILSYSFIFAGFCIVTSTMYQALGNGVYSLIVSFARQLLVLLPTAYIFASIFGLHTIWWSFLTAEFACVICSAVLFHRIYQKKIKVL